MRCSKNGKGSSPGKRVLPFLALLGTLFLLSCSNPTGGSAKSGAEDAEATALNSGSLTSSTTINTGAGDFREESIYFLLPARFIDGDSTNNVPNEWCSYNPGNPSSTITDPNDVTWRGDFRGLIDSGLAYIKDLGFSAVWITPPVQGRGPLDYHGYHAWDLGSVDTRLETPGYTYQDFINKAHSLGLKVVQDVVWNHSGRYGFKDVAELKYNTNPAAAWYAPDNPAWEYDGKTPNPADGKIWSRANLAKMSAPYNSNLALYNWPGTEAFVLTSDPVWFHHSGNGYAQGWDDTVNLYERALADDCPDLNTESQAVRDYQLAAYKKYIDMGVDAFRVDTVKHMSRETVLWFTRQFKAYDPGLFIFGEVAQKRHELHSVEEINPHWYTWDGAVGSSNNSGMAVLDFYAEATFHNVFEEDGSLGGVTAAARYDNLYSDPSTNVMWLDNHDFGPNNDWNRRYSGDAEGMATYVNFTWSWRGIPSLYYGSEIQFMKGAYTDIHDAAGINGSLDVTGRAFYGKEVAGASSNKLYQHIKKMNAIRRAVPALQKGSWAWAGNPSSGDGIGYTRTYGGVTVAVGLAKNSTVSFNFTGLPSGTYRDAVTGTSIVSSGSISFAVSGGSAGIYVLNGSGMIGALGAGFFQTTSNGGGGGSDTGWTECYVRGTNNAWGATAMAKNASTGLWETTAVFGADTPRFKISHYASTWTDAYPAADYPIADGAGTYRITFNETTKAVSAVKQTTGTWSVAGTITSGGAGLAGVTVSSGQGTAVTAAAGTYSLNALPAGTYTLTPTLSGYTFTPAALSVTVSNANLTGKNFTAVKNSAFGWSECYLRGTPNAWGATAMTANAATGLWETTATFDAASPRFKISRYGANWNEAYPSSDYIVAAGAGTYKITFSDATKAITLTKTGAGTTTTIRVTCAAGTGNTIYIRGSLTPLSWTTGVKATLTAGNVWVYTTTAIPQGTAFEFKALKNDSTWSTGANYSGTGGSTINATPVF